MELLGREIVRKRLGTISENSLFFGLDSLVLRGEECWVHWQSSGICQRNAKFHSQFLPQKKQHEIQKAIFLNFLNHCIIKMQEHHIINVLVSHFFSTGKEPGAERLI